MKKITWLLLLLLVLGALAYYLQTKEKPSSSIDLSDREFAYQDANDISRIEITKPNTVPQTFVRKGSHWYVNELRVADYKIVTLLKGLTATRVENIPPAVTDDYIKKSLKETGVHVNVYNNSGKKIRAYTIGPDAINDRCTYALVDGKTQSYCLNIAGFGSIRSRFVQQLEEWRDVALYRLPVDQIKSVKVEYHKDYLSSFQIDRKGSGYEVQDIGGKTTGKAINESKVANYLTAFEELNGEGYENQYALKDSIQQLLPFATVSLTNTEGVTKSMKLFPVSELIDPTDRVADATDALQQERYFVDLSTGDFMMAQQRLLMPVLRPYDYFLAN